MPPDPPSKYSSPTTTTTSTRHPSIANTAKRRAEEALPQHPVRSGHGSATSPTANGNRSGLTTAASPTRPSHGTSIGLSDNTTTKKGTGSLIPPQTTYYGKRSTDVANSGPNPVPCPPTSSNLFNHPSSTPITPPPSQSPPTKIPPHQGSERGRTMQRPGRMTSPPSSPVVRRDLGKESSTSDQEPCRERPNSEQERSVSSAQPSSTSVARTATLQERGGGPNQRSDLNPAPQSPSGNNQNKPTSDQSTTQPTSNTTPPHNSAKMAAQSQPVAQPAVFIRPAPPPPLLPPLQTSPRSTRASQPDGLQQEPSSPRSPDDLDSEDEEFEALVLAKKNQIKADIAAYQRSKELELVVYEKWLRDDLVRKKKKKAALMNGSMVHPPQHRLGYMPGYLPLLDNGNGNGKSWPRQARPSYTNANEQPGSHPTNLQSQMNGKPEQSQDRGTSEQSSSGGLTVKTEDPPRVRTPPRAPSPPRTTQTTPPPLSPTSAAGQRANLPSLSFSAIRALNASEKQPVPLASSLKSTSSWSSYSGKNNSRRNSSLDPPRKKKRVVFQLGLEEGGWVQVRPDGEEICRGEDPIEEKRASPDSLKDGETVSIIKRGRDDDFGAMMKEEESDGDQTASTTSSVLAEEDRDPDDDADWEPSAGTESTIPEELRGAPQFSDDSDDDDVFDLDEEIPLDFTSNNGRINSQVELDETVADLGLPLAPAPPQGPSPSAIFSPRQSGSSAFERAIAQIAGLSQQRSIIGSLSSSVPLNNYGLVTPNFFTRPVPFNRSMVQSPPGRPTVARQTSLDSSSKEATSTALIPLSSTPKLVLTGPEDAPSSAGVKNPFKKKSVSKYKATDIVEDESEPETAVTPSRDGQDIRQNRARSASTGALPAPSPYATSLPITITPQSSTSALIPDTAKEESGKKDSSTSENKTDAKATKRSSSPDKTGSRSSPSKSESKAVAAANKDPKKGLSSKSETSLPPKVSPQFSYPLPPPPVSKVNKKDAFAVESEAKGSNLPSKTLTVTASNKGASSTSGPIVQHFVTDSRSSAESSSTSNPKLQTPTKLTFPHSGTGAGTLHGFRSGSRYSSTVAAEAAAAAEAEGLDGESVVGGIDGRTGLDASSFKANLPGSVNAGSVAKSLEQAGIKPESMSFSMRLALEEESKVEKK